MMELFKLKAAHWLTSDRRLAMRLLEHDLEAEPLEQQIQEKLKLLNANYTGGGDPDALIKDVGDFIVLLKKYFDEVVFFQESESELYLLREEEDVKELYKGLFEVFELIKQALPPDAEDVKKVYGLLKKVHDEGVSFAQQMQEKRRKIRDQKRERERFRDKLFSLRKDFQERHAIKKLKKEVRPLDRLEKGEEKEIHSLEKHIKAIQKAKDSQGRERDLREIHKLVEDLAKDLAGDFDLLKDALGNISIIIDYAVYNFFRAKDLEDVCQQFVEALHNNGLWDKHYMVLRSMFDRQLEAWEEERERKGYRIAKKLRKRARKDAKFEANVSKAA